MKGMRKWMCFTLMASALNLVLMPRAGAQQGETESMRSSWKAGHSESTIVTPATDYVSVPGPIQTNATTISCGSAVVATTTSDYTGDNLYLYVKNVVEGTLSAKRSGCGREIRGDFVIKGWTVSPSPNPPMATIAAKLVNGCKLETKNTEEVYGSGGTAACGSRVNFSWTVNGVTTTHTETDGCTNGFWIEPTESQVTVFTTPHGCKYPPEPATPEALQVPAAPVPMQACDGGYVLGWETIAGATHYEVRTELNGSGSYVLVYSGSGTTAGRPRSPISVSNGSTRRAWVRACNGSGCGFYSEPAVMTYFAGCP